MTIEEWLAGWDALNEERERIAALFAEAEAGNTGALYKADEARTDLHEREAEFAGSAAVILRKLRTNSTLPSERGTKAWYHLDGSLCFDPVTNPEAKVHRNAYPAQGICDEHDQVVTYK